MIEVFSYGLPVISATIGTVGLEVTPCSDTIIIIGDDTRSFASSAAEFGRMRACGGGLPQREISALRGVYG